jgi:hypothetical protein
MELGLKILLGKPTEKQADQGILVNGSPHKQASCQVLYGLNIPANQDWSSVGAPGAELATLFMPLSQPDSDL